MNKEIFRILKEINSLSEKTKFLQAEMQAENERLVKIDLIRSQREDEKEEAQQELAQINLKIDQLEQELTKDHEQLSRSKNNLDFANTEKELLSLESQITSLSGIIDSKEEALLHSLELQEQLEAQLAQAEEFLAGFEKGRAEIEQDVQSENAPRKQNIESHQKRLLNLFDQIPLEVATKMKALLAKNLPKGPVTRLNSQNYCELCGTLMASPKVKEVEQDLKLISCSGCSRIIIPQSSLYL